ncbi:MAG: hypothetical protein IJN25_08475 [Clostridia bacterium]|nr:hypothetical protein [Clostridia bacterium]
MKNTKSTSILAAFSTLKALNDAKKYSNAYQLLTEFIQYIIYTDRLYSFTAVEMKKSLNRVFGFDVPEAVIKTASKILPYVIRENGTYKVDSEKVVVDKIFEKTKLLAENNNSGIIDTLVEYIKEKEPDKEIIIDEVIKDLIGFLIEEQQKASGQYTNLISEFILKHERDEKIQLALNSIREGSILYIGINYNINETGSLLKPITLYLGTEVLFSIAGFNGTIYKTLTEDFFVQVRNANINGEKIFLRYFKDVKKEIDGFFGRAEMIVEGKEQSVNTPAMKAIVNGCSTVSDIKIKKSDFYHSLQRHYGIIEDERDDYYSDEMKLYNLESMEYSDPQEQEGWKFVSHINKLRKGGIFRDNIEAEYLFITNTYNTLKISQKQVDKVKEENEVEFVSDYALSVDRMTNILWYKLGNGFGRKECPNNVNAILKARIVLASNIANNVEKIYRETNEQFKKGEITSEQLVARIITLRKKPLLPEDVEGDSIENSMDFSADFMSRFEEEINSNKIALREKDKELEQLEKQRQQQLSEKDKKIEQNEQLIRRQKEATAALESELATYRKQDEIKKKRKERVCRIIKFGFNIFWKIAALVIFTIIAFFLEEKYKTNWIKYLCLVVDGFGFLGTVWMTLKKDISKHSPKSNETMSGD